jgi:hypothetical protein
VVSHSGGCTFHEQQLEGGNTMTSAPFVSPEDDPQDRDRAKKTAGDSFFEAQWTPTALLPDPVLFCLNFTHRAVEVLHGVRDAAQLSRWATEKVFLTIREDAMAEVRKKSLLKPGNTDRSAPEFRLSTPRMSSPREGVIEVTITITYRNRVRASALRLEGIDGRWRVTSFGIL